MWRFLFSPNGRVSRKAYWLGFILPIFGLYIVVAFIFLAFLGVMSGGDFESLTEPQIEQALEESVIIWIVPAALLYFSLVWASIAVGFKRLHDRNRTGWWMFAPSALMFAALIPFALAGGQLSQITTYGGFIVGGVLYLLGFIISIWLFVVMCFLAGTPADNKYGPNPLDRN